MFAKYLMAFASDKCEDRFARPHEVAVSLPTSWSTALVLRKQHTLKIYSNVALERLRESC